MVAEVFAGLSAFKSMLDTAKALKDMNDAAIRNSAVIELQEQILSAQAAQSELVERIRSLEAEVAGFKTWESEKQRYELARLGSGGFVYMLKPSMQGSEPRHQICAACYQRGKKSILQRVPSNNARAALGKPNTMKCPECNSEIIG